MFGSDHPLAYDENELVPFVEPDFAQIDQHLGFHEPDETDDGISRERSIVGILRLLDWIRDCNSAKTKEIRIQAAYYFFSQKNQVDLAREIGCTKAAISQQAVALKDYFQLKHPGAAASNMRSDEQRQKFSQVCKSNHQQKKLQQCDSKDSPKTSMTNTDKPLALRAKLLKTAMRP